MSTERAVLGIVGLILAASAASLIWVFLAIDADSKADDARYKLDMAECMNAGKKQYECRAILAPAYSSCGDSTVMMPVPIVVPGGR